MLRGPSPPGQAENPRPLHAWRRRRADFGLDGATRCHAIVWPYMNDTSKYEQPQPVTAAAKGHCMTLSRRSLALGLVAAPLARPALAQGNRPVTIVVAFPPGG